MPLYSCSKTHQGYSDEFAEDAHLKVEGILSICRKNCRQKNMNAALQQPEWSVVKETSLHVQSMYLRSQPLYVTAKLAHNEHNEGRLPLGYLPPYSYLGGLK